MAASHLWWRDGVIYQVYPRSFMDTNQDGFGDLAGITSRLDYLADLGVEGIWLSPIYPSPDVDHGYDISDYRAIDPRYGSLEAFDRLVAEAHGRGLKIIMDMVMNHTSDQHPWFTASCSSREDPYHDWYLWRIPRPNGKAPNNWQSIFGGSGWKYVPATGQYYFHMFSEHQPDLNWRNPQVRQTMLDNYRFWLERGVDGFRLDVFNACFKDANFRNNPAKLGLFPFDMQKHLFDMDQPEMMSLLAELRHLLDSYPERYAVGETFWGGPGKAALYCGPHMLHGTFDFDFMASRWWRPGQFLRAIQQWEQALAPEAWPTWVLNNHDTTRSASRYGRGEQDARLKVTATLLLTQRGTPFIYYGEEIGQRDIRLAREQIQDPAGKRFWPFYKGRDGCRAPMQWDDTANAGFSPAEPWLPVHPDFAGRNVAGQKCDLNSLYYFYRGLIQLRKKYAALRQGMFLPLTYEPRTLIAYLRQTGEQTILVALNFSRRRNRLVLGGDLLRASWKILLTSSQKTQPEIHNGLLHLDGNEACILIQQ
jgi:alpha-glucosidase